MLLAMGRLSELSMSRMMPSGGRRTCTRSIQAPDRSVSAARFASLASHWSRSGPTDWSRPPVVHTLAADDSAHHRIAGEPLGIVDVLVAGEPAVDRLAQQPRQMVPDVPAAPPLAEHQGRQRGQAEDVVQLAVREQTTIRGDPGAVELELEAAIEGDP